MNEQSSYGVAPQLELEKKEEKNGNEIYFLTHSVNEELEEMEKSTISFLA